MEGQAILTSIKNFNPRVFPVTADEVLYDHPSSDITLRALGTSLIRQTEKGTLNKEKVNEDGGGRESKSGVVQEI